MPDRRTARVSACSKQVPRWRFQPVAGHISARLVARLTSTSVPFSFSGATLLRRVLVGDNVSEPTLSHQRRITAAAHKNVGLIDLDENGRYLPTAVVLAAFPDID
jgi:hypothetical protein